MIACVTKTKETSVLDDNGSFPPLGTPLGTTPRTALVNQKLSPLSTVNFPMNRSEVSVQETVQGESQKRGAVQFLLARRDREQTFQFGTILPIWHDPSKLAESWSLIIAQKGTFSLIT